MATGTACMETATTAQPKPAPNPTATPEAKPAPAWYALAAATSSGVLLWMCFQPLAWGTYLGWFALAPFFILVRSQARPSLVYFGALACGVAFFVPALQWMRVADRAMAAAWIALSLYCALYFVAAIYCIRCLERWKLPLVVSAPLAWVALEYFRCFALTGFPWYLLAHTQHDLLPMIQITDIGGVFLVSLMVVAVNAFLFDCVYQFPEIRQWFNQTELEPGRTFASLEILNRGGLENVLIRRNLILEGIVLTALLIGTYSYGAYRLGQDSFKAGPTVCLLQSNLDQRIREGSDDRSTKTTKEQFRLLCDRASEGHRPAPDLLIWPETSFVRPWVQVSTDLPIEKVPAFWQKEEIDIRAILSDLVVESKGIPHLVGMNCHFLDDKGKHRKYNSALMLKTVIHADGKVTGRPEKKFDKVHRVPFGEFLPFGDWLPFLAYLTPYEGDFGIQAGDKLTRFELGKHRFGVLLCYEDTDPFMARRYLEESEEGPAVDFLVNMSNDGWFAGSSEHEEHLAVSRFRAIECRRSMVRAVNMGVSAVIDGNGRVLKTELHHALAVLPEGHPDRKVPVWVVNDELRRSADLPISDWHKFKKTQGILKAVVPIDSRFSFYAMAGDVLPITCWAVLLGGAAWSLWRRRLAAKQEKSSL